MFSNHCSKTEDRHFIRNELEEAYLDFILSRQAMLCSKNTLEFYRYTAGKFVEWLNLCSPEQISSLHIRRYLSELADRGLADNTIHGHARAIKTFTRFLFEENYIDESLKFSMPSTRSKSYQFLQKEN